MHEMGIANSILEAVATEVRRHPGSRASKVGVRIGELAAIDADSLSFCFDALSRDTDLEGLQLQIEICPRRHRCDPCSETFDVHDYEFACPKCGSVQTKFVSGDELELAYLEVEENEPTALAAKVLSENDRVAASLRERFQQNGVLCVNLISSPGSGKTTLLERTLEILPRDARVAVLTGDIQTENDANRLKRFGFPVKQITTGGTCHLDARMIEKHLEDWDLSELDILFIENVGNLVCPSSYDLGEAAKIVILSVTEGEDKPLKYPSIFFKSELLILSKTDLLPHVPFDAGLAEENARRVHPGMQILRVSCLTRVGMAAWIHWLEQKRAAQPEPQAQPVA